MAKTQNVDLSGNIYDISTGKRFLHSKSKKISVTKKKTEIKNYQRHFDISSPRYRTSADRIRLLR